jgi:hypothetical protein
MSHCELYILFVMPHELMLHVKLCDMSHMLCYEIRNEVAKLPPHTWLGVHHPRGWRKLILWTFAGLASPGQGRPVWAGPRGGRPTPAA